MFSCDSKNENNHIPAGKTAIFFCTVCIANRFNLKGKPIVVDDSRKAKCLHVLVYPELGQIATLPEYKACMSTWSKLFVICMTQICSHE